MPETYHRGRMTLSRQSAKDQRASRSEVRQHSCHRHTNNMAIIEEIEDNQPRLPSPLVEELSDEEEERLQPSQPPPTPPAATSCPVSDFQKMLQDLTLKVALPSDLLPAFMSEQACGSLFVNAMMGLTVSCRRLRLLQGPSSTVPLPALPAYPVP